MCGRVLSVELLFPAFSKCHSNIHVIYSEAEDSTPLVVRTQCSDSKEEMALDKAAPVPVLHHTALRTQMVASEAVESQTM
jgi:hypothetical protein